MKWTWHHSKLAVEEVSFFGMQAQSGTPSTINPYTMKQSAWRTWMSCSYGPNTVLQKIIGECMFWSVFTYSSNPLTQNCEIVQLTRWAHRIFSQHFLPSSRQKKHGECLLLFLASKFRHSQHVNLKVWLFHLIGVKRWKGAECVYWGPETVLFLL